jgi:hypothetical protein
VRKIVQRLRNSTSLSKTLQDQCKLLNIQFRRPIIDSKTRWNSTFYMLNVFNHLRPVIHIMCASAAPTEKNSESGLFEWQLSNFEWELLSKLLSVLEKFEPATRRLSGSPSSYATLNEVLPYFDQLMSNLESFVHNPQFPRELQLACQAGWEKMDKYYNQQVNIPTLLLQLFWIHV